jgi:hypothetical protein
MLLKPRKRPVLFSWPSFLKCILMVQGWFTLVLQTCIYHALIKLAPHYLLFLYHCDSLIFNSLWYSTSYIHI